MSKDSLSNKKEENNPMMFFNLKNYTSPVITETNSRRWVNYGADNNYFEYLLERYRGSATNHALINGIYQMIVGNGLDSKQKKENPEGFIEAKKLFHYNDLLKWAFDLKCLGYYVMQVIMNKDMTKIVKVTHTPVQNWRSGIANEHGEIDTYWYSDDWSKSTSPRFRPKAYPVYKVGAKAPLQIYPVKPYRAGSFYYPNVDYQGALQYAHIEEEISNFHINNLLNGMFPGLLINFNNGDPGEEERARMEAMIKSKWGGSSNTAKIIVAFNDDKDNAATIEAVQQPDLDKMFDLLSKESSDKIFIGHRVTSPTLFGIRAGAGLGNNADELRVSSILFEETVLRLYRKLMTESMEFLLLQNGTLIDLDFDSLNPFPDFLQTTPEVPNKMNIDSGATVEKLEEHKPHMHDKDVTYWLNELQNKGEDIDDDEWVEIDASPVTDYEQEEQFSKNGIGK